MKKEKTPTTTKKKSRTFKQTNRAFENRNGRVRYPDTSPDTCATRV